MTRLLMTAYACDPNQGSESGAGWALLSAASELCESITVVTRSGEAPALESECEQLGCEVRVVRIATLARGRSRIVRSIPPMALAHFTVRSA